MAGGAGSQASSLEPRSVRRPFGLSRPRGAYPRFGADTGLTGAFERWTTDSTVHGRVGKRSGGLERSSPSTARLRPMASQPRRDDTSSMTAASTESPKGQPSFDERLQRLEQ